MTSIASAASGSTEFDVAALRAQFPSLASGIAHFDGPGGTQTPRAVADAIAATITSPLSNRGTGSASEANADAAVTAFRQAYADLLGVPARGIVHGRSATQLTFDFSRMIAMQWRPGDEVVVTRLDHDANVRPWVIAAEHAGAIVRWIDIDPATAEIDPASVESAITERTRLVAVTAASNLLGTKPAVRAIADAAHAVGALVYVDGVHYTAHQFVDVPALGADLYVCSPYKFLGPHCGVLAASPDLLETLNPDKLLPSTNAVPERFELGTLPYETLAGATAAVDFLADIAPEAAGATDGNPSRRERLRASLHAVDEHEMRLRRLLEDGLAALGADVVLHSRAADRTPTLLVTLPGRKTWDAYQFLLGRDVLAPAGSFYAYEPFRRLGLEDEHALRLGLAPYSNDTDIARVLDGLAAFLAQ
ncbi:cysteine desulfurase family protein, VC1184 subfamily [Micromonospora viridifaciens]|uniref:Cysteine desulfurase family protein, VC1184 subfamily n=1 Tax=Micromonospora viridifaciens TaxID=1881 RepID=A0A1C4WPD3_MICVI|nr:cysteine desulfurase-like protein [Micromonospora viridifaciens]SCE98070.1 cysteine desulfurase family protein, VC1184 subfamily [Micromonospora viridifaciens]